MKALGKICQDKSIWLIVNVVHKVGVLEIDCQNCYADFLITGGYKWLNAPYGCGLMVLFDRALKLNLKFYRYLALKESAGDWGTFFQDPTQTLFRKYKL